jgi:hypothetical protein
MRDAFELLGNLAVTGWKMLCITGVLALGVLILDRRDRPRAARPVRRVVVRRGRKAA